MMDVCSSGRATERANDAMTCPTKEVGSVVGDSRNGGVSRANARMSRPAKLSASITSPIRRRVLKRNLCNDLLKYQWRNNADAKCR